MWNDVKNIQVEEKKLTKRVLKADVIESITDFFLVASIVAIPVLGGNASTVNISNVFTAFAILFMVIGFLIHERLHVPAPFVFLLLFGLFCILSNLWALEIERSFVTSFRTMPLLILYSFVLYSYASMFNKSNLLFKSIYWSGIVLAVVVVAAQGGLSQYVTLLSEGERVGGNVGNENAVGMCVALSAALSWRYVVIEKRFAHLVVFAFCSFIAIGTGSNKAFFAIAVGSALTIILCIIKMRGIRGIIKAIPIALLVVAAAYCILQLPLFDLSSRRWEGMVGALTGEGRAGTSALGRIELTQIGIEQFFETPWLGIGINNASAIVLEKTGIDFYLHNNYAELLADCGIVGFALYYSAPLILLMRLIPRIRSEKDYSDVAAAILILWLFLQIGYVCYADKLSMVYLTFAAAVAYPQKSSPYATKRKRSPHIE